VPRIVIDFGMRKSLHLEIGIGMWNFDGWSIWANFLLWYIEITIYKNEDTIDTRR
jgi:hypothetical protein